MHLIPPADWRRAATGTEAKGMIALIIDTDLSILRFEAVEILSHCVQQELQMLRCHDDTREHAGARNTGRDTREVDDELRGRMRDDREIGINAFGLFFAQFDLELLRHLRYLLFVWVVV